MNIDSTSYTRFRGRWGSINVNVDNWRVVLLRQTEDRLRVERVIEVALFYSIFCKPFFIESVKKSKLMNVYKDIFLT